MMTLARQARTVLVSGANGYFGSYTCSFFASRGWRVYRGGRETGSDLSIDLNTPEVLAGTKIDFHVDLFIHAAAAHEIACHEHPYSSIKVNIAGTRAALEFCVLNGIRKFVYISTFHVFGHPSSIIDEDTRPLPVNDYGLSHLQAEQYVNMYSQENKIDGIVVRPSNLIGTPINLSCFNRWSLTPFAFCKDAALDEAITLKTHGLQKRNFVSLDDVCKAIEMVIDTPIRLLHVPGPDTISIRELAKIVQEAYSRKFGKTIQLNIPSGTNIEKEFVFTTKYADRLSSPSENIYKFIDEFIGRCKYEVK